MDSILNQKISTYKGSLVLSFFLTQLWRDKSKIFYFAQIQIQLRFKNTFFGFLWAAIEPLLYFIILYLVFTTIRERPEDFAIYLISGIMLFHIFTRGTSGGIGSLVNNRNILTSLNVKKEFFPIVTTASIGLLAFVDVGIFLVLMPVFNFVPSWTIILIPVLIMMLMFLVLGLNFLLSITTVYARDVQHFWAIFTHALFFITPIFWYLKDVDGFLLTIHSINPLGQIIELAHEVVIGRTIPPVEDWAYAILLISILFSVGYTVFHKLQNKIAEEL